MKQQFITLLSALVAVMTMTAANDIKPGQTWNDTKGSAINAHGGCVVYHD